MAEPQRIATHRLPEPSGSDEIVPWRFVTMCAEDAVEVRRAVEERHPTVHVKVDRVGEGDPEYMSAAAGPIQHHVVVQAETMADREAVMLDPELQRMAQEALPRVRLLRL